MRKFLISLIALGGLALPLVGCGGGQTPPVMSTAMQNEDGTQTIQITAKNGYQPAQIMAEAGKPLTIEFYRDETSEKSCVSELVIPEENINIVLPPQETTIVQIEPQEPGELTFKCGMDMMHGKIVFQPSQETQPAEQ